ncbi:response regulator transcription factor [Streptomyces montanisoli]|uniref:Response regulator transcription factor n=1 Tax=Streptomyces montanisoli TaxID=2798581 RepID=A0A940M6F7_9ACTN|nr:response regulator transcription factor [Streptomyces montanisoli]MBP0457050.1 response regulator transcription factor [Streptomyces montanisoli]
MTITSPRGRTEMLKPDGSPVRVLVVDDEASLTELLSMALRYEGWEVLSAGDGSAAMDSARDFAPDAVIWDVSLSTVGVSAGATAGGAAGAVAEAGEGGAGGAGGAVAQAPDARAVLRRLRTELPQVPVLFLTTRDGVEERIAGLTAGGDDYVTKPFSLEDVVGRLRGLIRRSGVATVRSESMLVVGDLTLDEDSHDVTRGGDSIHLTATEFELLRYLMRNPRRVLSKAQILDRVWSYDFGGQANVVELYISYLRRKIDVGRPPMIHTRRGAGYLIKPGEPGTVR